MTERADRSFSDGVPVESIDTEKSRIVLHELEPGWWILAVRLRCTIEELYSCNNSPSISHAFLLLHHRPQKVQRKLQVKAILVRQSNIRHEKSARLHYFSNSFSKHIMSSCYTTVRA